MMKRDYLFFTFWIAVPLIFIFIFILSGCTPVEIKIAEEVGEEVIETYIEKEIKVRKHETSIR